MSNFEIDSKTTTTPRNHKPLLTALFILCLSAALAAQAPQQDELVVGNAAQTQRRAIQATVPVPRPGTPSVITTSAERRQVIDAYWGPGPSTAEKLQIFDKFWSYVDVKFAA